MDNVFVWIGMAVGGCLLFVLIGYLIDKLIREPIHRKKIQKQNKKEIQTFRNAHTPVRTEKKKDN